MAYSMETEGGMTFVKHILSFLLALSLCIALSGCMLASEQDKTSVSPDDADVVHLILDSAADSYDVQKGGSAEIARYNFSRLVKISDNGDGSAGIVSDLAQSWEVSPDGLSYTFHLREGVLFHNEKEFESDDILYTADRMLRSADADEIPQSFRKIRGAADVIQGAAETIENLGIFISDKYTVIIVLDSPCVSFPEELTDPVWSIYNRDAENDTDPCCGTGPFIPSRMEKEDTWFLEKNEHYFGETPEISGIVYYEVSDFETKLKLFTEGKVDVLSFTADRKTLDTYLKDEVCKDYMVAEKKCRVYFYCMNQSLTPFSDLNVRKGLQIAIDRSEILDAVFYGQGQLMNSLVPEGMLFSDRTMKRLKYSRENAIAFFSDAGYSEGFGLTICQTGHSGEESAINEMVCQQLTICGINASVKEMDDASFLASKNSGNLPMYLAYLDLSTKDPDLMIHTCFGETGNTRWSLNYTDTDLQSLVEQSSAAVDMAARNQLYRNIETMLIQDDAVIIPMFQIYDYTLVNPRIVNYSSVTGRVDEISIR